MAHYQVILAYDGTEFLGFQRQVKNKQSLTIQGVFETALIEIGWHGRSVAAAGRTDTGVHASGQVLAFDLDWDHPERDLLAALNAHLPPDMAVQNVRIVESNFHPRFDACARRYRYQIFCQPVRDPLRERFFWRVWPPPDLKCLSDAASHLEGVHDFCAFGSPPSLGGSTIREVFQAGWRENRDELIFEICGNAFLYRMVRRLVRLQVTVGQGKLEVDSIRLSLLNCDKGLVRGLAPAKGLNLVEVIYSDPVITQTA